MLEGLLEKKLSGLKGKEVLVVMDDDFVFLGELVNYDKKTLVLKRVLQAPNKNINWKKISEKSRNVRSKKKDEESEEESEEKKLGFMNWSKVNLEEVYLRVEHITRIWKWGKIKEVKEETGDYKKPIYYEKDYM